MKKTDTFADFPLALGAEWLTGGTDIFAKIVNDNSIAVNVKTIGYKQDDRFGIWENGKLTLSDLGAFDDKKFVHGTWFDFFEKYIVPSVSQHIVYNAPVQAIDYTGDFVVVRTHDAEYSADKVIVTVPLPMLQNGTIAFTPALPTHKVQAINQAIVWDGIKVQDLRNGEVASSHVIVSVCERSHCNAMRFFPPLRSGQNDMAPHGVSSANILGLFAVGHRRKTILHYMAQI